MIYWRFGWKRLTLCLIGLADGATFSLLEAYVGLMSVMSEWVQANTSILSSKTCRNCSFSFSDKRELTYVCLSGPPNSIDSKGSIANCSLSPSLLGHRTVIAILGTMTQLSGCWGLHLSHAPILIANSIGELLTGCSRGQSVQH